MDPHADPRHTGAYHASIVGPELIILIIVLVVVLAWRGPTALPRLGEAFGKAVKGARENMPGGAKAEADDGADAAEGDSRPAP
jgi:Sec-independent protein translocase protein TatA